MDKVRVLTPLQEKLLTHLFADEWFRRHFYLTGGTALSAFYLFHRSSDDLDLFCHGVELTSVPRIMEAFGRETGASVEKVQSSPGFMRFTINASLKVDFVVDSDFRVGVPELVGSSMVDSMKNIAVNKVCAILGRFDAKDYVDLYFLVKEGGQEIFELLSLAQKKDAGLDLFVWASLVADVTQFTILPRMIRSVTSEELTAFFLELRDRILDHLNPQAK